MKSIRFISYKNGTFNRYCASNLSLDEMRELAENICDNMLFNRYELVITGGKEDEKNEDKES